MIDSDVSWPLLLIFILLVFGPLSWRAWKRRHQQVPPMAKNDRKLYRLWQSDPQAYERQYGEMDRQLATRDKSGS
ncbi:hypothetical protein [Aliamphritea hakodatensis]|uniref:hypothetical protein n=1 Tax=Aliamphritea hakodatensis TaxID=2895352 RepID=UPI0022FDAE53|nr:hypothetical protein [Aliamphritea hakodatensis]